MPLPLRTWHWFLRPTFIVLALYFGALGVAFSVQSWRAPVSSTGSAAQRVKAMDSSDSLDAEPSELELQLADPALLPEQVVQFQLKGLQDPNSARGISQCFVLASPANRAATGPLPRFAQMVAQPPYDQLVHADALVVGRVTQPTDSTARVVVVALHRQQPTTFVWILSRQPGPAHAHCWMTDSVLLLDPKKRSAHRSGHESSHEI